MHSLLHHKGNSKKASILWVLLVIVFWSTSLPAFVSGQELHPEVQVEKNGGGQFGVFPGSAASGKSKLTGSSYQVVHSSQVIWLEGPAENWSTGGMDAFWTHARSPDPPIGPVWDPGYGNHGMNSAAAGFQENRLWDLARDAQNSITVLEGNSIELSVDAPSSVPATITVTSSDETKLRVSPAELKFTAENTTKTITLTAEQDSDTLDAQITLTYTIKPDGGTTVTSNVDITIMDDDAPLKLTPLLVTEGTATFTPIYLPLHLGKPSGEVTFTVTGHEDTDLALVTTTLTFPVDSWDREKRLIFSVGYDDDEMDDHIKLTLTASGGGFNGLKYAMDVTIVDKPQHELLMPEDSRASHFEGWAFSVRILDENGLLTKPSHTYIGTWTGYQGTDVTVTPSSMNHPPESFYSCLNEWDLPAYCSPFSSVNLYAGSDEDEKDDQETLTLEWPTPSGATSTLPLHIRVEDDDDPGLIVNPSELAIREGEAGKFTVRLSDAPLGDLGDPSVTVRIAGSSLLDRSTHRLTFTRDNWNTPQEVTLTAGKDYVSRNRLLRLWMYASGGGFDGERGKVDVTILNYDQPEITVTPETVRILEGSSNSFQVSLSAQPLADVAVTIPSFTNPDLTHNRNGTPLMFTPSGTSAWNITQTVTVMAAEDENTASERETLTLRASGGVSKQVAIETIDNDVAGITVIPGALSIDEGSEETFKVALAAAPLGQVTVTIASPTVAGLTLDSRTLTFTPSGASAWNVAQPVRVTAAEDENTVSERETLTLRASGGVYDGVEAHVNVATIDNDVTGARITVNPGALSIDEGSVETFKVALAAAPLGQVTVTIASPTVAGLTLDSRTLTFTPSGASAWNVAQSVRVTAAEDENTVSERETLTLRASGGGYDGVEARVNVATIDNDVTGARITVNPGSLSIEEGSEETFKVALAAAPLGQVTVTIASPTVAGLTLDSRTLTFTPSGASAWNVAQPVRVTAAEDENTVSERETLTLRARGGGYDGVEARVNVATIDNDVTGARITVNPGSLSIEEGSEKTFKVALAAAPLGQVTVTIASPTVAGLTLDSRTLTFTPSGASAWNVAQPVRVTAAEDENTVSERETLTLRASGGGYDGVEARVNLMALDNDAAGTVTAPRTVEVDEGSSKQFAVKLSASPLGTVTVRVSEFRNSDLTRDRSTLTFTELNYGTEQFVTVSAKEDASADHESEALTLRASGGGYDAVATTVLVHVRDLDREGIEVVPSSLQMSEGDTETLAVRLASQPLAPVTIDLRSSLTVLQLDPLRLDFTESTWNRPIMVTVHAPQDSDSDDESGYLTFTATGGDYDRVETAVPITVSDSGVEERGQIRIQPSVVRIEEGSSGTFAVSLSLRPTAEVTVSVPGFTNPDLTHDREGASLTFTAGNYQIGQIVTVSAARDATTDDETEALVLTATGGNYDGVTQNVRIEVLDLDHVAIVAHPSVVVVTEGGEATFDVSLSAEPPDPVTVSVDWGEGSDLDLLSAPMLLFSPSDWKDPQTVTLTAAQDATADDEEATVTLSAPGWTPATVQVLIEDDDTAGIVATPGVVEVPEGQTEPFTVSLTAQPLRAVTVTIRGHEATDLVPSTNELTFTTRNWNVPQPVTLRAENDSDYEDEEVVLTVSASGGGYDQARPAEVQVTILDKGPLTISIYDGGIREAEGPLQLRVALNRPAERVVTVQYQNVDHGDAEVGTDYTASRGIVIFAPGTMQGVVRFEILDDDIQEDDETFGVTLSSARGALIARGSSTATIMDDDQAASLAIHDAVVDDDAVAVRFEVQLSHPSSGPVSVRYRTADGTARAGEDYAGTEGILMFAPGTMAATLAVPLLRTREDWGEEAFFVHLTSAESAGIAKAVATATIREADTRARNALSAYAARFVRTSSTHLVEALQERLQPQSSVCSALQRAELSRLWHSASFWRPSLGELLSGCRVSGSTTGAAGSLGVWGRGAFRQFQGRGEAALTLRGTVATGMFGVDYRAQAGWLAGVMLAHSRGNGSFAAGQVSGDLQAQVTGIYPYVSYARAEWEVWMSGGYGRGEAEAQDLDGDLTSGFGALGLQGKLASVDKVRFNYHADVLLTDARVRAHEIRAEVSQIRFGIQSALQIRGGIRPYVEANVRRDGGSAETGVGLELGGGIRMAYPAWRLRADLRSRGLVLHSADGFTEWGISGSLQLGDPSDGLMVSVRPSWGPGQGMSLYRQQTILDTTPLRTDLYRTELEVGYGIPVGDGRMRSILAMTQLPNRTLFRLGGELQPRNWMSLSVSALTQHHRAELAGTSLHVQGSLRY